jgi:hypothetical protein
MKLIGRTRILLSTFILLLPISGRAELCWMAGCRGDVAYIYIPDSQISVERDESVITMESGGHSYRLKLDSSGRLLQEYGLPQIGSVVTLNVQTDLLPQQGMGDEAVQHEISKVAFVYDLQNKTASLYQYRFEAARADTMRAGATILILGYTGDALAGHSRLFALVMVKTD